MNMNHESSIRILNNNDKLPVISENITRLYVFIVCVFFVFYI